MTLLPASADRGPLARAAVGAVLLAVVSYALGVGLAAVGAAVSPTAMLALPVGVVLLATSIFRPALGLALVVATIPIGSKSVPLPLPGDVKVIHVTAAFAVVAVLVHRLAFRESSRGPTRPVVWLLGIFALAIAATPGALDVQTAVKQDVTFAIGVALVLALPAHVRNLSHLRQLVLWLLVIGSVACLTSFGSASALHAAYNGALVSNRAVGVFHQPNELGTFSAMLLMLALGVLFGARSFGERVLALFSAVAGVGALALTLSRGAWIGAVLAALLFVWLLPQARRAVIIIGVPLVAVVAVLGAFRSAPPQLQILTERVQSITTPAANPYDDRPAIYREAFHIVATRPGLGVGPENFIIAATKGASDTQTVAPLHAHNFVLTVATEMGVPAALLLMAMTISVGLRVRSAAVLPSRSQRALAVGLGAALVVLVGQGLVDFTLRNPTIFMFVWLVFAMALVAVRDVDARLHAGGGGAGGGGGGGASSSRRAA